MPLRNKVTCPDCGQDFYAEFWQFIDLGQEPDLRARLLDGEINLPTCPHCGALHFVDTGLIVHDPTLRRLILFAPSTSGRPDPAQVAAMRNTIPVRFPGRLRRYQRQPIAIGDWNSLLVLLAEGASRRQEEAKWEALVEAILALGSGPTWEAKHDAVHAHPELLSPLAAAQLAWWIARAQEEGQAAYVRQFTLLQMVLARCRAIGVDAAFAAFARDMPVTTDADGTPVAEIPLDTLEETRLDELQRLEEAAVHDPSLLPDLIALYEQALEWPTIAQDPELRAAVYLGIGTAYHNLPGGNVVHQLRAAIAALGHALATYTFEADPERYATAQNELGLIYLDLPTYDQAENLQRAIACFKEALRYRSVETGAYDYAGTCNNLGMALTRLQGPEEQAHLARAVALFEEALRIYTPQETPDEYAKVCNNLGTAYDDLAVTDPGYLERAVACYRRALDAWTALGAPPWLCATVRVNLGNAYAAQADAGLGPANAARQAEACYAAALRDLDPETQPRQVAWAHEGLAHLRAARHDRACAHLRQALDLLSPNTFPTDQRRIARALGDRCLAAHEWDAAATAYREGIVAHETLYTIAATDASRHREQSQAFGLFHSRAYALARQGYLAEAVAQLEAGRAQTLAEALARDTASLAGLALALRADFVRARDRLGALQARARGAEPSAALSSELRAARQELSQIVAQIRERNSAFMAPPLSLDEIAAGPDLPLVYLITAAPGSLALIVPPQAEALPPDCALWLDAFREADLEGLLWQRSAGIAVTGGLLLGQIGGDRQILDAAIDRALPLLEERLVGPLVARLRARGYDGAVLVPGGRLALLPLHAPALERATLSYAPSARALPGPAGRGQPPPQPPTPALCPYRGRSDRPALPGGGASRPRGQSGNARRRPRRPPGRHAPSLLVSRCL